MSPRRSDARQRVVATAAEMLARHGLNATSIREMAKRADAPLGSTYHHFPNGKQQVVAEAVEFAGARVSAGLEHHLQSGIAAGLQGFLGSWREILIRSDFRMGCPVMAAAVEEPLDEAAESALRAAAAVFDEWETKLVSALRAAGQSRSTSKGLAQLIIASTEGSIVLCRAQRSIEPFDRVAAQLKQLIARTLSGVARPRA